MATVKSTEGIKTILNLLEYEELEKLAITTTQNLIRQEDIKSKEGTCYYHFY